MAYGTDAGLTAYLTDTGRTLPVGMTAAVARHFGTVYVDSFEDMYRGTAVTTDNSFPRDLWLVVPAAVENAAYEAAFAYASGVDIFSAGGSAGGQVIRKKLDVMELQYAEPQVGSGGWWENNRYILPLAYALLLPFFKRKGAFAPSAFIV